MRSGISFFGVSICAALLVLFTRSFDRQGPRGRFLSRHADGAYVIHIPYRAARHGVAGCAARTNFLNDENRLAAGYELLQRFRWLINHRSVRDLIQLPVDAGHSGLRPFASLARGIEADYAAVVNGLKPPGPTGPVEDTVTRVKAA